MIQDLIKNESGLAYKSPDTGLTPQQEKCAILMASGTSISDVSKQIQVGRATIYRWLGLTTFKCFLNLMKKDAKLYLEGSLLSMQSKAIDTIKASLDSDTEAIKVKSAMWVMERVQKMEIGASDIRSVLKAESQNVQPDFVGWQRIYNNKLIEAGLSE